MDSNLTVIKFLELIGWGDWAQTFLAEGSLDKVTFADLTFGTLPFMLQLFLVIFFLNWIMGIIGDVTKNISRGGRF